MLRFSFCWIFAQKREKMVVNHSSRGNYSSLNMASACIDRKRGEPCKKYAAFRFNKSAKNAENVLMENWLQWTRRRMCVCAVLCVRHTHTHLAMELRDAQHNAARKRKVNSIFALWKWKMYRRQTTSTCERRNNCIITRWRVHCRTPDDSNVDRKKIRSNRVCSGHNVSNSLINRYLCRKINQFVDRRMAWLGFSICNCIMVAYMPCLQGANNWLRTRNEFFNPSSDSSFTSLFCYFRLWSAYTRLATAVASTSHAWFSFSSANCMMSNGINA